MSKICLPFCPPLPSIGGGEIKLVSPLTCPRHTILHAPPRQFLCHMGNQLLAPPSFSPSNREPPVSHMAYKKGGGEDKTITTHRNTHALTWGGEAKKRREGKKSLSP